MRGRRLNPVKVDQEYTWLEKEILDILNNRKEKVNKYKHYNFQRDTYLVHYSTETANLIPPIIDYLLSNANVFQVWFIVFRRKYLSAISNLIVNL